MEELGVTTEGALTALRTLEAACTEAVDHGGHWLCRTRFEASTLETALSVFLRLLLVDLEPSSQLERPFRRVNELIDGHLMVTLCPDCVEAYVRAASEMTKFLQDNFEQDTVEEALHSVYYPYHYTRLRRSLSPSSSPVSRAIALLQYWGGIPSILHIREVEGQPAPSEFLESLHFSSRAVHRKLIENYEHDDWVVETVCASLGRIRVNTPDMWISPVDSPWVHWEGPLLAKVDQSSRARKVSTALLEASVAATCSSSSSSTEWWFPRDLWMAMACRGEPSVLVLTAAAATSAHSTALLEEGAKMALERLEADDFTALKDTCFSLATIPSMTEVVDRRLRSGKVTDKLAGLKEVLSSDSRAVEGLALWCQQQLLAVGVDSVSDYAWELLATCAVPATLQFVASIPVLKVFLRSIGSLAVEVLERRDGGGPSSSSSSSSSSPLNFVEALVNTLTGCPKASLSYNLFDVAALHTALSDWVFENVPTSTPEGQSAGSTAMTTALASLEKRIHADRPLPVSAKTKSPLSSALPPRGAHPSEGDLNASLPSLPSSPDDWDTYTPSRSIGVLSVSSSSSSDEESPPPVTEPVVPVGVVRVEEEKKEEAKPRSNGDALKAAAGALDRLRPAATSSYRSFTNNPLGDTGKASVQSKLDRFLKPKGATTASAWHSTSRNSKVERVFANMWDQVAAKKCSPAHTGGGGGVQSKHKRAAAPSALPPPPKPHPVARLAPSPKRATSGFAIPTGSAAVAKAEAAGKPPPMFESRRGSGKPRRMKMERTKIKDLSHGLGRIDHPSTNSKAIGVEREHAVDDLHTILLCRDPFSNQDTSHMLEGMGMLRGDRGRVTTFTSADDYVKEFRPALLYESAEGLRRSLSSTEGSSLYWGIPAVKISRSSRKGKWATLTVKSQCDEDNDNDRNVGPERRRVEALSQGDLVLLIRPSEDGSSSLYDKLLSGAPLVSVRDLVESPLAFGVVFKEAAQQPGEEEMGKFRCARIKIPFQSEEAPYGLSPQSPWSVGSFCQAVVLGSTITSERECEALDWVLSNNTLSPLRDLLITPSVPVLRRTNTSSITDDTVQGDLNQAQLRAVTSAADVSSPITLVQGPPGTGKTKTIVAMVKALLKTTNTLVICAPSNAAVDELASRIMASWPPSKSLSDAHQVLRVGSCRRITREEVKTISLEELAKTGGREKVSELRGFHKEKREEILKEIRKLEEGIKELTGDNDSEARADRGRLVARKKELKEELDKLKQRSSRALSRSRDEACKQLLGRARVVLGTLSSFGSSTITSNFVARDATCIIDEACQAIEPSALIPLKLRGVKRLVLVGDPQQLPATVVSMEAKALRYERSLFERLIGAGWKAHLLDEQYRMLPEIANFASKEFYDGRLRTAEICRFPSSLGQPLRPLLFLDSRLGSEQRGGTSLVNTEEAIIVGKMVEAVANRKLSVGVVTPYRQQALLIRRTVSMSGAEVDTVDAYQGQEKDIIIMSCVRSNRDGGIGFVADYRRLNVSLTRAKYALWIVGNAESLGRSSKVWADLIHYCQEHESLVDASRIQKRSHYAEGGEPTLDSLLLQQEQNKPAEVTPLSPQLVVGNKRMRCYLG